MIVSTPILVEHRIGPLSNTEGDPYIIFVVSLRVTRELCQLHGLTDRISKTQARELQKSLESFGYLQAEWERHDTDGTIRKITFPRRRKEE